MRRDAKKGGDGERSLSVRSPRTMAETITDAHVAAVLRVFVRGCGPLVQRLREGGDAADGESEVERSRLGKVRDRLAQARFPGSDAWARMDAEERSQWWVGRAGRLTALITSVAGLTNLVSEKVPLKDVVGSAGQGLLLCAMASERGIDDVGTRVRLPASVLFGRDIAPALAAGAGDDARDEATAEAIAGERPEDTGFGIKTTAVMLWGYGRLLTAVREELANRPRGKVRGFGVLGRIPLGAVTRDYLHERSALERCAVDGATWIAAELPLRAADGRLLPGAEH